MLSRTLFLFLFFGSIWQFDVTVLYAHSFLSKELIEFMFRLLRIGSIMLPPALFHVAYAIDKEMIKDPLEKGWKLLVNKYVVSVFYFWSFTVYLVGWSTKGIEEIILIESDKHSSFYFPVYGTLSWVFHSNVALFVVGIITCILLTLKLRNNEYKSFLLFFIITITIGYAIGMLNVLPEARLYPSGFAVGFFAIAIFGLSLRLHVQIVNNMNEALDNQRSLLQKLIDLNPNYIYAKNKNGIYTLANTAFADLHGLNPEEMIGKTEEDISTIEKMTRDQFTKSEMKNLEETFAGEEKIRDRHGNRKWLKTFKVPIRTDDDNLVLGVSSDITELKEQEEKIRKLAYHDSLTQLPNRRLFDEDLSRAIKALEEDDRLALLFMDLDGFKNINDTLGHDIGDLLLVEISSLLQLVIDNYDHRVRVYRIGGDEFTVIFQNCTNQAVTKLANDILDIFKQPIFVEKYSLYITPSIGISMYPDDGEHAIQLMKYADAAMYVVKEKGKNGFQFYTPEINLSLQRKMTLEKQLHMALEDNEFELYYQPQLDLESEKISGVEALVRWNNNEFGFIPPCEFIPLAEESNLILPIGKWIMREACLQNKKWQERGFPHIKIAVNISIKQFNEQNFVESVSQILNETKLNPEYLELEITESIAIMDHSITLKKLHALKNLGVKISIDDFGTGYSSFGYLQKYPINILKIDKSFITGISNNKDSAAIVKCILALAQHLQLDVVAEGVETKSDLDFLLNTQCKYAQGYYIGHPMSAEKFEKEFLGLKRQK
ncbi:diguanylate cyclase/phosphodiesterase [Bacillus freudenreichii]|nr:diguanylate cyclase/phosphodiesterase [Bacillus freudenreichii]